MAEKNSVFVAMPNNVRAAWGNHQSAFRLLSGPCAVGNFGSRKFTTDVPDHAAMGGPRLFYHGVRTRVNV